MKRFRINQWIAAALLVVVSLSACKKDMDDEDEDIRPSGFWKGVYGSGSASPSQPYAVLFRDNGTLRVYSQSNDTTMGSKAEGTWTVEGDQVKTHYVYFSGPIYGGFSTVATNTGSGMSGTYGLGTATSGSGSFNLNKQ